MHGKVTTIGRHLSIIEKHYRLVGHVLIGEAKNAMKNKGKIIKVKRNLDTSKTTTVACMRILGIDEIIEECFYMHNHRL